jgi:hypothetical protein
VGIAGYVTARGRRLALIAVNRGFSTGTHHFRLNLFRRNRASLLRFISGHRKAQALLTITAMPTGAPSESTTAQAVITLGR